MDVLEILVTNNAWLWDVFQIVEFIHLRKLARKGMLRAHTHTIWKAMVEVLVSIALINWLKIIALQPLALIFLV